MRGFADLRQNQKNALNGMQIIFVICFSLIFSTQASAQQSRTSLKKATAEKKKSSDLMADSNIQNQRLSSDSQAVQTNEIKLPQQQPTYFGQIRFETIQYFTEIPSAPQLTTSQFLSARLSGVGHFENAKWLEYAGDLSAGTFFSRQQSNMSVSELYASALVNKNLLISVGRKKYSWSEFDSRWQLGLWQPYYALDSLRPDELGLTGAFFDLSKEKFQLVGFVSPIFIPTMGPQIHEENGSLISDSRWYRSPSKEYNFNNRINTLNYNLSIPATAQLVGNPGTAFLGKLGDKENGFWGVAAVGYKPVNELLLKRQSFKNTSAPKIDVTVSPDVTYHSVHSADLGYTYDNVRTSISYLEDDPREKRPDEDWVIQRISPLRAYSANVDWNTKLFFSRPIQMNFGYMKIYGAEIQDINSAGAPDDTTLFDQRMKFTNAFLFKLQGQVTSIMSRPLITKMRYLYDSEQKGSLLSTEFMVYPVKEWAILLGTDILGVDSDTPQHPSWFLNQFRANDRVYGGMTYVF